MTGEEARNVVFNAIDQFCLENRIHPQKIVIPKSLAWNLAKLGPDQFTIKDSPIADHILKDGPIDKHLSKIFKYPVEVDWEQEDGDPKIL